MSLTYGTGPLGPRPAGRFNADLQAPDDLLYLEPVPARIRVLFEGETVVDARDAKLLHSRGRLPVYYFPMGSVRTDLLAPSETRTDTSGRGVATYWSVRVGDRIAADAAWSYEAPVAGAELLAGHIAFDWAEMDEWFAEDEQLLGHPRDPYSRIDVLKTTRHVRVTVAGEVVADTRRAKVLLETGLPPRWYIPPDDVRTELLVPSANRSRCAYKGSAAYWHVRAGGELVEDVVWAYPAPEHDALRVRDYLCFFNERVDLEIDGERLEPPATQWSRGHGDGGAQALRGLMRQRATD